MKKIYKTYLLLLAKYPKNIPIKAIKPTIQGMT